CCNWPCSFGCIPCCY
uniref:Conotoxin pr3a n=1 Tax=Conus parius TaxID=505247 RepID=CM3A_CONPI|nr:RecName: Full=Conotoxin pr3a [Conus parius]